MGALQPMHLIVVLVIILLIFGPGKLPELGRAVGDGMRELKKATSGDANAAPAAPAAVSAMVAAQTLCPACAKATPAGQPFCGHCGGRLAPQAA